MKNRGEPLESKVCNRPNEAADQCFTDLSVFIALEKSRGMATSGKLYEISM